MFRNASNNHLLKAAKTDPTCYGSIGAKLHPRTSGYLEGVKNVIEY